MNITISIFTSNFVISINICKTHIDADVVDLLNPWGIRSCNISMARHQLIFSHREMVRYEVGSR